MVSAAPILTQALGTDDFTIALIPDPQNLVESAPADWEAEMQWLADNAVSMNIKAIIGLGDNTNYLYDGFPLRPAFYTEAKVGWDKITELGIPYIINIGNHDYDVVTTRDATKHNEIFGQAYYAGKSWYGGSYLNQTENTYIKFTVGGYNYLVFALELFPRDVVLTWAQGIINTNPTYNVIVTTHAYLMSDGTLGEHDDTYGSDQTGVIGNDGQPLWDNFIKINPQIIAVFCGHFPQAPFVSYLQGINNNGGKVVQIKADYQGNTSDFITLIKVKPYYEKMGASSYSPKLDSYDTTDISLSYLTDATWWNANWDYRQVLSFNASTIAENLIDFPIMVHLTGANFTFAEAQANGEDIRFIESDDATDLAYEIEKWDSVGEDAIIWVKVPQINANSAYSDYIYMYWGNAGAADAQDVAGTWNAGYSGVWHMNDETTATILDSTSNNNDGAKDGANTPIQAAGKLGYGQSFDNTNKIDVGGGATLDFGTSDYSVEMWVKLSVDQFHQLLSSDVVNNPNPLYVNDSASGGRIRTALGSSGYSPATPSNNLTGLWRSLKIAFDRDGNATFIVNGVVEGTADISAKSAVNMVIDHMYIGYSPAGGGVYANGSIDEVRISKTLRSAAWLQASYMSENDTLLYFGDINPEPTVTSQAATGITMDKDGVTGGAFNGNLTWLGGAPTVNVNHEYGLTNAYGAETATVAKIVTGAYTTSVPNNLTPGQTYHFRSKADNLQGISYGADQLFTLTMPTITTGGYSSSNLYGTVSNMGVASSMYAYFEWGVTNAYGNVLNIADITATGTYSGHLVGHDPTADVHYRFVVEIDGVVVNGPDRVFPIQTLGFNAIYNLLPLLTIVGLLISGIFITLMGVKRGQIVEMIIGIVTVLISVVFSGIIISLM